MIDFPHKGTREKERISNWREKITRKAKNQWNFFKRKKKNVKQNLVLWKDH